MHCQQSGLRKTIQPLHILIACFSLIAMNGCSICCNPYLEDYAAFNSKYPRLDMKHGRVGSVFSDPQLTRGVIQSDVPETIYSSPLDENALPLDSIEIESSQIGAEMNDSNDVSIR